MSEPNAPPVIETNISGVPVRRGKVRDVYDLGDEVLLVATDRISAYDVVLPSLIPGKGAMLTRLSRFWFDFLSPGVPNHLIEVIEDATPPGLDGHLDQLRHRTMRCRKCAVVPIEFVVRGYLAGSGWADYRAGGSVCGVKLPPGLRQCDRLPEPIFTPATKADVGHDQNVTFDQACQTVGREVMTRLRDLSLAIYRRACEHALSRGIIIADTKLEWGRIGNEYILIDEVLTPDSSRFWPAADYEPGRDQDSFDKQYVRNYLTGLCDRGAWDKSPPGPELPEEIIRNTAARYADAVRRLTG